MHAFPKEASMWQLLSCRSFEARSSCLRVVVLLVVFIVFIIIVIINRTSASPCFFPVPKQHQQPLQHDKEPFIAPSHRPTNPNLPLRHPDRVPDQQLPQQRLLPPPQTFLQALHQLNPRRKSQSAPLRSKRRRPRKMTTTRTRILMIPKAKGKRPAPRAKNTMLLQTHTLLRRNMPKIQAASQRQIQASARFRPQSENCRC
jgi:hypothetical protein